MSLVLSGWRELSPRPCLHIAWLICLPILVGCSRPEVAIDRRVDALLRQNLAVDAARLVESERHRDPSNAHLAALLGRVRLAQKDWTRSDEAYSMACAADTVIVGVRLRDYIAQGGSWTESGDFDAAAKSFDRAYAIDESQGSTIGHAIAMTHATLPPAKAGDLMRLASRYGSESKQAFARDAGSTPLAVDVSVGAARGWVATDFTFQEGDSLHIRARGQVRAEASHEGWVSEPCGPAGWPGASMEWLEDRSGLLAPRAPRMALLGRLGTGPSFVIGSIAEQRVTAPGRLYVAVNDLQDRARDAAGSFEVRINAPISRMHPVADANP